MQAGVWQLQRVTLRFCNIGGSSTGAREFIAKGHLANFARRNPQVELRAKALANRHPVLFGEYKDGTSKEVGIKNQGVEEIGLALQRMRDTGSGRVRSLRPPVVTTRPSVQGVWDPSITYESFELRDAVARPAKTA